MVKEVKVISVCKGCGAISLGDHTGQASCRVCGEEGTGPHYAHEDWCELMEIDISEHKE
jgi:hypothetical protein